MKGKNKFHFMTKNQLWVEFEAQRVKDQVVNGKIVGRSYNTQTTLGEHPSFKKLRAMFPTE